MSTINLNLADRKQTFGLAEILGEGFWQQTLVIKQKAFDKVFDTLVL